jgi:hypothetical protein
MSGLKILQRKLKGPKSWAKLQSTYEMTKTRQKTKEGLAKTSARFPSSLSNTCQVGSVPREPTGTAHPVVQRSSDWFSPKLQEKRNSLIAKNPVTLKRE